MSMIKYYMNLNVCWLLGPDKGTKYVILGEKAKAQLIRDSKKDIELSITELQKNPLNYTQVSISYFLPRQGWLFYVYTRTCSIYFFEVLFCSSRMLLFVISNLLSFFSCMALFMFVLEGICSSWWHFEKCGVRCFENCFQQVSFSCLICPNNSNCVISWGNENVLWKLFLCLIMCSLVTGYVFV